MKKLLLLFSLFAQTILSQSIIQRDTEIESLVKQVSADSLKSYIETLVSFGTRATLSDTENSKRGIGAARKWVLSKFLSFAASTNGRMTTVIDEWNLQPDGRRINKIHPIGNVIATLKGTDPTDHRIFMVSGHIDSRVTDVMNVTSDAPGANDDGSGTAAVIELARVLSNSKFGATIQFVVFSGEEQGLLGSKYMADKALKDSLQIEALLNNDIMGSNHSNETHIIDNTKLRVFSEGLPAYQLDSRAGAIRQLGMENDGKARQLARYVKEIGERYVDNMEIVMIYRNDRFLRGGDHTSFVTNGFAAIRFSEMNENFLHQHQDLKIEKNIEYGDLSKFMDFEYLRKNTAVNLSCLANLAKAPSQPKEVTLEIRGLGNSTTINWKAPNNGKVKGYYVLIRESAMPYWQKKIFTADLKMTLPYSKDNYFFAVQSVSLDGNEGLPLLPRAGLRNAAE